MPEEKDDASAINNIKIQTDKHTLDVRGLTGTIAHVHCTTGMNCFGPDDIRVRVNEGPSDVPSPPIHQIGLSRDKDGKLTLHLHLKS